MKVLVINCGSSSLKYQLFDMENEQVMVKGLVERIGIPGSVLTHRPGNEKHVFETQIPDHKKAITLVLEAIIHPEYGVLQSMSEITAIGHRVVHGSEDYAFSVLLTDDVMEVIKKNIELAPLHNPPNIMGIEACQYLMPTVPQVCVFDTAFHQTMPPKAYLYGIPYEYYEKYKIRKYGFHGTSHQYVSQRAAALLGQPRNELKIIACHLGNGSSISAVKGGQCVDTTMGFTPLEGLMMGTRSGDLDPTVVTFLMEKEGWSCAEANNFLNKQCGVLGLSGVSSDFRDLESAAQEGNQRAQLALDRFAYGVKKFIGAYAAVLNGVDALVFTAGLGENSASMREKICQGLDYLGIEIDAEKNKVRGQEAFISTVASKTKVLVIPTNEELMIARDTYEIVNREK
ncbi:MAG: acetate kinase [Clostridia bacterium]|nr:acetate kinase [Clostridia bacterium]